MPDKKRGPRRKHRRPLVFVAMGEAAQILGVKPGILRSLHERGAFLPDAYTRGGHRRYRRSRLFLLRDMRAAMPLCTIEQVISFVAERYSDVRFAKGSPPAKGAVENYHRWKS